MIPKQNAESLIDQIEMQSLLSTITMPWYLTVECALITTESHITELQHYSDLESSIVMDGYCVTVIDRLNYWNNVKGELEEMR